MGFAPASSVPSAGGGGGVVQQGARDATAQAWLVDASGAAVPVTGPLTSAQLAALEPLSVTVGNFPASQPVTGPLTDAQLRAAVVPVGDGGGSLTVDGTVALDAASLAALETINVGNFPASQPVTGPLTDVELRASAVPVSVVALPLPSGAATETTLAAIADTLERAAASLDDLAFAAVVESDEVAA